MHKRNLSLENADKGESELANRLSNMNRGKISVAKRSLFFYINIYTLNKKTYNHQVYICVL